MSDPHSMVIGESAAAANLVEELDMLGRLLDARPLADEETVLIELPSYPNQRFADYLVRQVKAQLPSFWENYLAEQRARVEAARQNLFDIQARGRA